MRSSAKKPDPAKVSKDAAAGSSMRCSAAQKAREWTRRQPGVPTWEGDSAQGMRFFGHGTWRSYEKANLLVLRLGDVLG